MRRRRGRSFRRVTRRVFTRRGRTGRRSRMRGQRIGFRM